MVTDPPPKKPHRAQGWSRSQQRFERNEKSWLAKCFANHAFLVDGEYPEESEHRVVPHAAILANTGTTAAEVVRECLIAIERRWRKTQIPFHTLWQSPGAFVATVVREFVLDHPDCRTGVDLFLVPGKVDYGMDSVTGDEAVSYLRDLSRRFTYTFLSVHRIDLASGQCYFFFPQEVAIQTAIAFKDSLTKNLFLTPSKFYGFEGDSGYNVIDLFNTTDNVNLFVTVDSNDVESVRNDFTSLCVENSFTDVVPDRSHTAVKRLQLCFVQEGGEPLERLIVFRAENPECRDHNCV